MTIMQKLPINDEKCQSYADRDCMVNGCCRLPACIVYVFNLTFACFNSRAFCVEKE